MSNGFHGLAPFGLLEFSGDPTPAEEAYDALVASYGTTAFDLTTNTELEAETFATALQIGFARQAVRRAAYQQSGATATDKLPSLERDWGVIPGPNDTIDQRRAALVARKLLMHGSRQEAIEGELRTLLGANFYTLRVTKTSEAVTVPAFVNPPVGAFQDPQVVPKFIQLLDPIAFLGVPITVRYALLAGSAFPTINEVFCVEPYRANRVEAVTVSSLTSAPDGTSALVATFTQPHDPGTIAMTCAPWQLSNQREVRVIVSQAAATNVETRRKIHEVMARHEKTVTQWEIIGVSSPTTVGPFIVGQSIVGDDALGTAAFTF